MSDHSETRYRSNEDVDRELEPAGTRGDPLAELARLIGQNDPFAHMRPHAHPDAPRDDHLAENRYSDWRDEAAERTAAYDEPRAAYDEPQHPLGAPSDLRFGNDAALYQDEQSLTAEQSPEIRAAEFETAATEQFYDEPPAPKRVGMAAAVIVLVGCVAVGAASAFAYRAYLKLPETSAPPPVIHASSEPTKVVPPPAPKTDTSKLSYDRVGDRSQNEKVVPQEEKPIDPKKLVTAAPPPPAASPPTQAVPVAPPAATAPTPAPQAAAPAPPANPSSVLTEPKRVRTVAVRPDQSDTAPPTQLLPSMPPPAAVAARSPATSVFPAPPTPSAAAAPPSAPSAAPKAAARPQTRTATPAPANNAPSATAPLSLNPSASTASTNTRSVRAAAPPTQVATAAPPPAAPKATKARPSGYMVQVASQRSEADAQASFRSVRTKYSNVIGTGEPVIRRADLGAKGIYYRAMVGPYATRDEAVQVCANLKAAGGSCVVQSH